MLCLCYFKVFRIMSMKLAEKGQQNKRTSEQKYKRHKIVYTTDILFEYNTLRTKKDKYILETNIIR